MDQPGHVLRTSAYTQGVMHPALAILGTAAAVVAVGRAVGLGR